MTGAPMGVVVLVEDNLGDARLLREMFNEPGLVAAELVHVERMSEAERYLAKNASSLILLDLGLPDAHGLEAVRRAHDAAQHVPLVVISGMDDESMALQALQQGAQDYLIKGQFEPRELQRSLRYAIERKHIEETLFSEKERAQATLRCIGDAVVSTDILGNITFLNLVAEEMTGWTLQEATGRPLGEVFFIVDATTRETVPNPLERAVAHHQTEHLPQNCVLIRRDGVEIPVEDSASPIRDHDGLSIGAVLVFRNVNAAREMAREMSYAAALDHLTGLPNRLLLNERIQQAIALATRHSYKVAILYLDLDGFKHINDSLGHSMGDKVLQSVAKRLLTCVRAPDTVSRQGGDEFLVLLSEVEHPDGSVIVAKRMLNEIAKVHTIDERDLHLDVSIGVSVFPDDGLDAETLIKCADIAMYQAKESGRKSYKFFTPAMNARAMERQSIEENLRRALDRREFEVHYQPKVDLRDGTITGAEALLRWMHPTLGSIPPSQFIPVAEDCGLILPIGTWVLREACAQAQAWACDGLSKINMAVNVSALQFRDPHFLMDVFTTLSETGLDPRNLELEVTEGILMKRAEFSTSILKALRDKGLRVAIDDFGMGYSSLSYLRKFPLDTLKIDQSFIRQMTTESDDSTIVRAIISIGQNLKLRVIAEGIETAKELTFLQAYQCMEGQGYHFSHPVPANDFAELLKKNCFAVT